MKSFVNLAQKIESVGASTFLGMARHINDTSTLNAGAVRVAAQHLYPTVGLTRSLTGHRCERRSSGWLAHVVGAQEPAVGWSFRDAPSPQCRLVYHP